MERHAMKRVIYNEFGNPTDVLHVQETATPEPQDGQSTVQVLRSPINPSDWIQVAGHYGVRPDLPATAGNEGLGRVTSGPMAGQLVLLPAGTGAWVTEVICETAGLVPLPEGDLDQLSMLAINPATAYLLLSDFVELSSGDWIIQSAANSAVGTYVNQLAKARGINVLNIVRRESAVGPMQDAGCEHVLVDGKDLPERVKAATNKAPVKLALDAVAGETLGRLADCLGTGATLVNYGAMSGAPAQFQAGAMIFRDVTLRGFWLVHWFSRASRERRMQVYGDLTRLVASGELYAPVAAHFTLDQITDAVAMAMAGKRDGKVMLAPNGI